MADLIWLTIAFPLAGAVFLAFAGRRLGEPVAGWVGTVTVAASFLVAVPAALDFFSGGGAAAGTVELWSWIPALGLDATLLWDPLSALMTLLVTGVGALIHLYSISYMGGDERYGRYFSYLNLFVASMLILVLGANFGLLFVGWELVGLSSYLLISFWFTKRTAAAAGKKAFIVNRIGDVGFMIALLVIFGSFGTFTYGTVFEDAAAVLTSGTATAITLLLFVGAVGKSAQLPLHVWLPDAMEGPTPVSALIHAATMVTAGVYLIARLMPLFVLSPATLTTIACIGAATALFAATIALCQYDIKRIYAYSTISQLGYMFLGVGVLSSAGAIFHLFTHAFFKALLFLTAGSVMHSMAGQLDLRKMSGLRTKMPWTCGLMLVGCLSLAGFPFLAGFYSKDLILAAVIERGLKGDASGGGGGLYLILGLVGLGTALLTAFYTFRLWFRVFLGPPHFEMGSDHHGEHEPHEPHEVGWLMNGPLVVLALGAAFAGVLVEKTHWMEHMIEHSSANPGSLGALATPGIQFDAPAPGETPHPGGPPGEEHAGPRVLGLDLHTALMLVSGFLALVGIAAAAWFHWLRRQAADRVAASYPGVVRLLEQKYFVDQINDAIIVRPLNILGSVLYTVDRLLIEGLVLAVGWMPRMLGLAVRHPTGREGVIQSYGLGMVAGATAIVLLVVWAMR